MNKTSFGANHLSFLSQIIDIYMYTSLDFLCGVEFSHLSSSTLTYVYQKFLTSFINVEFFAISFYFVVEKFSSAFNAEKSSLSFLF